MTDLIVSNKLTVKNATEPMFKWCARNLVLDNPDYYKAERMGRWTGNLSPKIVLYEKDGNDLYLPFGCLKRFYGEFKGYINPVNAIRPLRRFHYVSGISLYAYQEKAVIEAIRARNGVIVMPCGAGKTQTALELISRIGGKCLWLTHTQDLLNQSMNRARSVLGVYARTYGTITGGKVNIGTGITFATVQTMAKLDLISLKDSFDIVIVDECHKAVGSPTKVMQFYKVLSNISCRYKFGLTATPKRADGLEKSMFALLGDIIYEVDRKEVEETTCPVKVQRINTEYVPNMKVVLAGDGTLNYASLVNDLTHNEERFELVKSVIKDYHVSEKKPMLVLANRVEYLERLSSVLSDDLRTICLSALGNTKSAKKERKEAIRRLNDGELDCIFATYQLAKEGLDVPRLGYVVFATPEKDETTVTQAAGRVARKADGKEYGTVIDFVDDFGMLIGWWKKRVRIYKNLKFSIDI